MPSRFSNRSTAYVGLAVLLSMQLAAPASGQQLTLPSDLTGGVLTQPTQTGANGSGAVLTQGTMSPLGPDATMVDAGPMSAMSSGQYYNPTLGSHIRARFNTRSYGQQQDTLDLGTMKLMELDGGMAFIDGQVTMNDDSGVGYNLGVGYRWMTLPLFPWSPDDEKIMGISLWSDGQTVGKENFFSQVGVSLEFLGDHLDFRANGYAPVGSRSKTRDFLESGELTFTDHFVAPELIGVEDTALTVGEAELAGRLGDLDAWAFAGVYGFAGGGYDAVGGKLGLRGYATPDLLLSVAVANDDQFDTNALFSATWFIGRTRAENCPTGVLRDRMREPVIRNDYIATEQSVAFAAGDPILGTDGELIRFTHVDSSAAAGGDGSFENPLNDLGDIELNSEEDDFVYAHGGSDFNGQTATLLDGQTFYGEGNDNPLEINDIDGELLVLPETSAGALSGPVATIDGDTGAGVILADNNVIENLEFDGGTNAIVNGTDGSLNPTLRDLTISGTTGDAISLTTIVRADTEDFDDDDDLSETLSVLGAVTIDEIAFNNVGGADIAIDGEKDLVETADNQLGETITISNVTSTNNQSTASISITETTADSISGGSTIITNYDYSDGMGGLLITDTDGSVSVTSSSFTGGTGPAVTVTGNTDTVSVGSTTTIDDITGDAVVVTANEAAVTIDADITTDSTIDGGGVVITGNEAVVDVGGNLEANNSNLVTVLNAKGDINIGSAFDVDTGDGTLVHTGTGTAISITDNGAEPDTSDTDADSVVGITINGNLDNDGGQSVVISGGNDDILFSGEIDDTGEGIAISEMLPVNTNAGAGESSSSVRFGADVTVETGANDAVVLGGGAAATANDETSTVDFQNLSITTTSGRGLVSNDGILNVDTATDPTSTITTGSGQAIEITGGSSTDGVNFASVDTTNPDTAVTVTDFAGTVAINGGTLATQQLAVDVRDATVLLDGVDINSANDQAIQASFTDDVARTLSVNEMNANGGDFDYETSGTAATTVNITELSNGGSIAFDSGSTVDDTLSITDAAFVDGFAYTASNSGGLNVTMVDGGESLTGGSVSFVTEGSGGSSLNVTDLVSTGSFNYSTSDSSTLDVDMTTVTSTGAGVVGFTSASSGDSTLDITDSGTVANPLGPFSYVVSGAGDLAVSMTDIEGTGNTNMTVTGAGDGSLTMDGVTTDGEFDFSTSDAGNVTINMTDVTGVGDTTLATTAEGDASLTATNLNTGGAIDASGSAASTGDLSVSTTNSGNTTAFTAITVNQQGTGAAIATFNNTSSDSGIDFDSASDTTSALSVSGGDYGGGAIAFDETGDGDATVSLTNVENAAGVTVNEAGEGDASLTMSGESYAGAIALNEAGNGNATASLTNVTSTGGFTMNEAGDGDSTLTMNGTTFAGDILFDELGSGAATASLTNVTTTGLLDFDTAGAGNGSLSVSGGSYGGAITADAANGTTGSFTASVTNGTAFTAGPQIVFNAQNTGAVTYEVNALAAGFSTGANVDAIDLTLGANVTTADVTIASNTDVQTLDGSVVDLTIGGGVVNFLMSGNTFANTSASQTALITHNGTLLNATITGNAMTNSGAGDALELVNPSGSTTNLVVNTNGPAGSTYDFENLSVDANAFRVRGDSAASVDTANDGTVNFTGVFDFDNSLVVPTP